MKQGTFSCHCDKLSSFRLLQLSAKRHEALAEAKRSLIDRGRSVKNPVIAVAHGWRSQRDIFVLDFKSLVGAGAIMAYIGGTIGDTVGFTLLMGIFGLLFIISTLALFGIKEKKMGVVMGVIEDE